MINFAIGHYMSALRLVSQEIEQAQFRISRDGEGALVLEPGKERIRQNLHYVLKKADDLGLESVRNRVERIFTKLRTQPDVLCLDIANEMNVLLEAFEDDTQYLYLYAYPREKVKVFLKFRADWQPALAAFPSIADDCDAAADLYALERNTACVFHCMRVLEHGLKALAADVGETFDTQQWGTIISAIEGRIKGMRDNGIPGLDKTNKDARLQFLSEAAKDFAYFKDGWRNYVSHGRAAYDGHQAVGVLEHTKSFMNRLAARLSEAP